MKPWELTDGEIFDAERQCGPEAYGMTHKYAIATSAQKKFMEWLAQRTVTATYREGETKEDILLTPEERKAATGTALVEADLSQPHDLGEICEVAVCRAQVQKVMEAIFDEVVCPMCYRLNPQHAMMDYGAGCHWCQEKENWLKAAGGEEK